MFFWTEEIWDLWDWSLFYYVAEGLDVLVGLVLIFLLCRGSIKKKDDRLLILFLYLFLVNVTSYDLTLSWRLPYNLIPFAISIGFGYWIYCSKKNTIEWDEKERKGIVSSHEDIYEKQQEDFKKLSAEEQEEWYQNYLQTAPPKLTLKWIIIINIGAYLLATAFKLVFYFFFV